MSPSDADIDDWEDRTYVEAEKLLKDHGEALDKLRDDAFEQIKLHAGMKNRRLWGMDLFH